MADGNDAATPAAVPTDAQGRRIYTLVKPVQVGDSLTVTELRFREPLAGDLRAFPLNNPTAGDLLDVAAKVCNQPPLVMSQLSLADVVGIGKIVLDFLPDGLLTGGIA